MSDTKDMVRVKAFSEFYATDKFGFDKDDVEVKDVLDLIKAC